MTAVNHLADLVTSVTEWEPSAEDLSAARRRLFDAAVAATAAHSSSDGTVERLAASFFGRKSGPTPPAHRLFEFASVGRSSEVDDLHLASCSSPGMIVVPTIAALGDVAPAQDASDVLRVIARGYEFVTRAATSLGGPALLTDGIWPSLVIAPIGAAYTAARLFGLDESTTLEAVGLACGVSLDNSIPDPGRRLQFGSAVLAGASGALAARSGCAAGASPLTDWVERSTRGRRCSPARFDPPTASAVVASVFKPFCGARQGLAALAGVMAIADRQRLAADDITEIRIGVPSAHVAMLSRPSLVSRLDTFANLRYQVALCLLSPSDLFDLRRLPPKRGDEYDALIQRVSIHADEALDEAFPSKWGARVEVKVHANSYVETLDGVPGETDLEWSTMQAKAAHLLEKAGIPGIVGDELYRVATSFTSPSELAGVYEPECLEDPA